MKKHIWMLVPAVLAGCGRPADLKAAVSSAAVNVVTIESGSAKTAYESYDTYQNFTVLHDMLVDASVNRDAASDSGLTEYAEKPVPATDGTISEGDKSIAYGRTENGFVLKVDEEPETYLAPAASAAYDLTDSLTNAMYKATGSLPENTAAPLACTIRPSEEIYEGCVLVQQISAADAVYEGYMELTGTVVYEQAVSLRRDEPFEQLMRSTVCIADTEDLNPGDIIRVQAAKAEIEDETGRIGESTLILSYEKAADLYTTEHRLSEFIPEETVKVTIETGTPDSLSMTIHDPEMIADLQTDLSEILVYEEFARQFGSGGSDLTLTFTSADQETTEIVVHNNGLYFSISGQDILYGSGKDDRSIFTCINRFLSIEDQPK